MSHLATRVGVQAQSPTALRLSHRSPLLFFASGRLKGIRYLEITKTSMIFVGGHSPYPTRPIGVVLDADGPAGVETDLRVHLKAPEPGSAPVGPVARSLTNSKGSSSRALREHRPGGHRCSPASVRLIVRCVAIEGFFLERAQRTGLLAAAPLAPIVLDGRPSFADLALPPPASFLAPTDGLVASL